jgi:hypothetical protein
MGCTLCNHIYFTHAYWDKIVNHNKKKRRRINKKEFFEVEKELAYDIAKNHPEMVTLILHYNDSIEPAYKHSKRHNP